jgi:hypothetical protein
MSKYYIFLFYLLFPVNSFSNEKANSSGGNHPCLILQKTSVPALREGIKKYPPLTASFEEAKKFADEAIKAGIKVPVPKDPAGGYTHIQHIYNYEAMFRAGEVYQLTGDKSMPSLYATCYWLC